MPKPRTFSLREERRRIQRENPPIEISLDDPDAVELEQGQVFEPGAPVLLPHPATWRDEVFEASKADIVGAARLLLGDSEYDRFRAAGGEASFLFDLVKQIQGVGVGESAPSSE